MKVKVCGMREPENIAEVLGLGIDYMGFIFHPASPRFAGQPELGEWITANGDLFTKTQKVGVFVNAGVDYVLNTVHDYELDWVQLHGDESPGYCAELKLLWSVNTLRKARITKAFRVDAAFDFSTCAAYASSCPLFIFDTGGKSTQGGTGEQWNWSRLSEYTAPVPFLLSGGIGPLDADEVKAVDHPQLRGVDLNSKFEVEPGLKDTNRLRLFLNDLRG